MSIVGISGSSNLYQYLQSLNNPASPSTTAPQTVGATDTDGDSDGSGATPSTVSTTNSQNTSSTSSGTPSLIQQLEAAILGALNGVNSSQSNNPQTALSSIEQAVQTTLQNNGIDPTQLAQSGGHHHHHGGGHGGSGGGILAALGANGSDSSSTSGDGTSSSTPSTTSQTPTLDSLLGQLNVDPQQFRNDIISALSSAQNGTVDQSQIFQSFPTGQNVNVLT
jgi:hypothetical protein